MRTALIPSGSLVADNQGMSDPSAEATWRAVDSYLDGVLLPATDGLEWVLRESATAGLPAISVSPLQGRLLQLLVSAVGAVRVLEIGTLGGYSALWLARALPDAGRLVTLEVDPKHAAVARSNIARAGLEHRVDIRVGAALDTLEALAQEALPPFDLAFIDADKIHSAEYFSWAVRLSRPGAVIVVDNVVRDGRVLNDDPGDAGVSGARRLFDTVSGDVRVSSTVIQTVGAKGYDGFLLAVVAPVPPRPGSS